MNMSQITGALRRRWAVIVAALLIGALAGLGAVQFKPQTFTSASQLYVSVNGGDAANAYQGGQAAQQRIASYASLATGEALMAEVIAQLKLDITPSQLASHVSATYPPGTVLLNVQTTDPSATTAKQLNSAVVQQLQSLVTNLETTVPGGTPAAQLQVVNPSSDAVANGRSGITYLVLGAFAGFVAGLILTALIEMTDRTVRHPAQLRRILDVPVVGSNDRSILSKVQIRELRSQVLAVDDSARRSILVAALDAEGHDVAFELAAAIAAAGSKTALVRARFDQSQDGVACGLAEVLRGEVYLDKVMGSTDHPRLSAMLPGQPDDGSVDALASRPFRDLMATLRSRFDCVVLDGAVHDGQSDASAMIPGRTSVVLVSTLGINRAEDLMERARPFVEGVPPTVAVGLRKIGSAKRRTVAVEPAAAG